VGLCVGAVNRGAPKIFRKLLRHRNHSSGAGPTTTIIFWPYAASSTEIDSTSLLGLRAKKSDHTTKTPCQPSQRTQTSGQHHCCNIWYLPPRPTKGNVRIAVGAEAAVNICGDSTQEVTDGTDLHGCISS